MLFEKYIYSSGLTKESIRPKLKQGDWIVVLYNSKILVSLHLNEKKKKKTKKKKQKKKKKNKKKTYITVIWFSHYIVHCTSGISYDLWSLLEFVILTFCLTWAEMWAYI